MFKENEIQIPRNPESQRLYRRLPFYTACSFNYSLFSVLFFPFRVDGTKIFAVLRSFLTSWNEKCIGIYLSASIGVWW